MTHWHAFDQGIDQLWREQSYPANEFLSGQSTNMKPHDTIERVISLQMIEVTERKHDQNEVGVEYKPNSGIRSSIERTALVSELERSSQNKYNQHITPLIEWSISNKIRPNGEMNNSIEIIPFWENNEEDEIKSKFRNSGVTYVTFNTKMKNFKGLLREFRKFFRANLSFSKNILKMDFDQYMDCLLDFLSSKEFINGVKNILSDTKESKIPPEIFQILAFDSK